MTASRTNPFRPPWRTRLLVYASVGGIAALVAGGAWLQHRTQSIDARARTQRTRMLSAITSATAHGLEGWVTVAAEALNDAAAAPRLRSAVAELTPEGRPRTDGVKPITHLFDDDFGLVTQAICQLRTPDGQAVVAAGRNDHKLAWLMPDMVTTPRRGGAVFVGPAAADGTPTLALVAPVGDPHRAAEAYLVIGLESDEALGGMPALTSIGDSARAVLFDAHGHTSADSPARWRPRAGGGGSVAAGEVNEQGVRVMAAWAWRPRPGLGLALEVDEAELLAGVSGTVTALRVLGVMLWVLAAAFAACFVRLRAATLRQHRLAQTDALTGMANRRRFDEALEHEVAVARRSGKPLSLLMIDVDHFKAFNDAAGHPAGDACLKKVARHVRRTFKRTSDLPARYGGEEFAVILPMTGARGARQRAEKIRANLSKAQIKHPASPTSPFVTVSIGVASVRVNTDAQTPETLTSLADMNLYAAKESGRDRVEGGNTKRADAESSSVRLTA